MGAKKAFLYYFTGTGNSLRVLTLAKQALEKDSYSVSLESIAKNPVFDKNGDFYGFCFPVYSLAVPRIALKFLKSLPVMDSPKKAFFFITGGDKDDAGWSLIEGKNILEKKGFNVVYTDLVTMPSNWVPFDNVPSPDEAKTILADAETSVLSAMKDILGGKVHHKPLNVKKLGFVPSFFLYVVFRNLGVKRIWKFFKANDKCNGCAKCSKACPTKSIVMKDNRPKWSKTCEQCMRCVNVCANRAIEQLEAIGKGSTHNRYLEPHFKPLTD